MPYKISKEGELSFVKPYIKASFVIPQYLALKVISLKGPVPRRLKHLDLSGCENLTLLPCNWGDASQIEELVLVGCKKLESIVSCPPKLRILNICASAVNVRALPDDFRSHYITILQDIKPSAEGGGKRYRSLSEEQAQLEESKIPISEDDQIEEEKDNSIDEEGDLSLDDEGEDLGYFVSEAGELYFSNSTPLSEFVVPVEIASLIKVVKEPIPDSIVKLDFEGCENLEDIEDYPLDLEELNISQTNIQNLISFRINKDGELTFFSDVNCDSFVMPQKLAKKVKSVKGPMPEELENLDLRECENLQEWPDDLSQSLSNLILPKRQIEKQMLKGKKKGQVLKKLKKTGQHLKQNHWQRLLKLGKKPRFKAGKITKYIKTHKANISNNLPKI